MSVSPSLREYAAEKGMLAFGSDDDAWDYGKAVERYAADGDRAAFMRALMTSGIAPTHIHWHLARPGRLMAGVQFD
jgi:hypothetical protein